MGEKISEAEKLSKEEAKNLFNENKTAYFDKIHAETQELRSKNTEVDSLLNKYKNKLDPKERETDRDNFQKEVKKLDDSQEKELVATIRESKKQVDELRKEILAQASKKEFSEGDLTLAAIDEKWGPASYKIFLETKVQYAGMSEDFSPKDFFDHQLDQVLALQTEDPSRKDQYLHILLESMPAEQKKNASERLLKEKWSMGSTAEAVDKTAQELAPVLTDEQKAKIQETKKNMEVAQKMEKQMEVISKGKNKEAALKQMMETKGWSLLRLTENIFNVPSDLSNLEKNDEEKYKKLNPLVKMIHFFLKILYGPRGLDAAREAIFGLDVKQKKTFDKIIADYGTQERDETTGEYKNTLENPADTKEKEEIELVLWYKPDINLTEYKKALQSWENLLNFRPWVIYKALTDEKIDPKSFFDTKTRTLKKDLTETQKSQITDALIKNKDMREFIKWRQEQYRENKDAEKMFSQSDIITPLTAYMIKGEDGIDWCFRGLVERERSIAELQASIKEIDSKITEKDAESKKLLSSISDATYSGSDDVVKTDIKGRKDKATDIFNQKISSAGKELKLEITAGQKDTKTSTVLDLEWMSIADANREVRIREKSFNQLLSWIEDLEQIKQKLIVLWAFAGNEKKKNNIQATTEQKPKTATTDQKSENQTENQQENAGEDANEEFGEEGGEVQEAKQAETTWENKAESVVVTAEVAKWEDDVEESDGEK